METTALVFDITGQQVSEPTALELVIEPAALISQKAEGTLSEQIQRIAAQSAHSQAIGIRFEKFTDGRSYSIAARLIEAGYAGELHALGDINQELVFILKRVGFTHFHIPDPGTSVLAETILKPFAGFYQAAPDGSLAPWQQHV